MDTRSLIEQVKRDANAMIQILQQSRVNEIETCFKYVTSHRRDYCTARNKVQD